MPGAELELRLHRSQSALRVLTKVTEVLLHSTDELELAQNVCRVLVQEAGLRLAWIGYADGPDDTVPLPVAVAGDARGYVDDLLSQRQTSQGTPTAQAMKTMVVQIIPDTLTNPGFAPWRDLAVRHDIGSIIALPLAQNGRRLGSISLYAQAPQGFSSEQVQMLGDLSKNLTFAIEGLRGRAEHARTALDLAESEQRYRTLVEMSPDAIIVHTNGIIVFANGAAATMLRTSTTDLIGRPVFDFTHPESREEISHRLAVPPTGSTPLALTVIRRDGSEFDAEVSASNVTFHGRPARIMVVHDVSERRQMNDKLIQAAKLSTLGEMTAGIIHELSQPLNVIRMTAEGTLLFIQRGKLDQDWQIQQFTQIAEQAARTADIIDDIRIFTRRDDSPEQVFDALSPLRSAISVMEGQINADGITLISTLADHPLPVRGRRNQLEQVALNLLSNAQHALKDMPTPQSDDHMARITVSAQLRDDTVEISISDTGPGISPAVRAKLFQAFVTTKAAGRGTGLGLSVSYSIIAAMGGRMELADQSVGACFTIRLPLVQDPSLMNDPPLRQAEECRCPCGHIMVVEDNETAARTMQEFLSGLGHRVSLCASGSQALDLFRRDPADIVITDLRMPSGDGEYLFEELRDFDPLQPIIIVTGQLDDVERLHSTLADDRCAIFKKPVALGKLSETICVFLQPPSD